MAHRKLLAVLHGAEARWAANTEVIGGTDGGEPQQPIDLPFGVIKHG